MDSNTQLAHLCQDLSQMGKPLGARQVECYTLCTPLMLATRSSPRSHAAFGFASPQVSFLFFCSGRHKCMFSNLCHVFMQVRRAASRITSITAKFTLLPTQTIMGLHDRKRPGDGSSASEAGTMPFEMGGAGRKVCPLARALWWQAFDVCMSA